MRPTNKLNSMRHLTWDSARRRWRCRFTIDMGPKVIGRRVVIDLPHEELQVAMACRDAALQLCRKFGVTVCGFDKKRASMRETQAEIETPTAPPGAAARNSKGSAITRIMGRTPRKGGILMNAGEINPPGDDLESPIFCRPDGRPLPGDHHLSLNPRGKFVLRVTLDHGAKFTGKREVIPLRTKDAGIAMLKRDAIIEAYKRIGVLCRDVVLTDAM